MRKLLQFSSNMHSLFSVFVVDSFMFVTSVTIRTSNVFINVPSASVGPGRAGDSLRIEGLMKVDMVRFQGAVLQAVERADRCDGMLLSLNPHLWRPEHRQSFDRDEQPWDITWSVLAAFSARYPDLGPNDFTLGYHGTESASHVRCFLLDGLQEKPGKGTAAVFAPVAKDCRRLDRTHSPWWPRLKGSGRDNLGVVVCVLPKSACRTQRDGAIQAYVCDALPVATYQYKSRDQARDNSNALM
jgi:hypothetical protein